MREYPDAFDVIVELFPGECPDHRRDFLQRAVVMLLGEVNFDVEFHLAADGRGVEKHFMWRDDPAQCRARQRRELFGAGRQPGIRPVR